MKKQIPEFTTDGDAEVFVDVADLTEYDLSGFKRVQFEFQTKAAQLNMRLPQTLLSAVKERAKAQGIPYTRLVREMLETAVADRVRSKGFTLTALSIESLQLVVESQSVLIAGQSLPLTSRERAILELLLIRKNMIVTKEAVLTYLYGDEDLPELKLIDVLVMNLRKKLLSAGASDIVKTVWGRGYTIRDEASDQPQEEGYVGRYDVGRRRKYKHAS